MKRLFLDIDGVIFPLAKRPGDEILVPDGYVQAHCLFDISYHPDLPAWLQQHQHDLVWSSTWGQDVSRVNQLFGLDGVACLDVRGGRWQAVQDHVDGHKFAWAEDKVQSSVVKQQVRAQNGFLIQPARHVGLTSKHMQLITDWLS